MGAENECHVTGNLGRDPEMKFTKNGKPYCKFSVAASYYNASGNEFTEWVPIQVWGPLAESCGNNLQKGSRVTVRGRFSTSSWQDDSGKKRYYTQLVADQVAIVLPGSPYSGGGQKSQPPKDNGQWGGNQQAPARPPSQGQEQDRGNFGQFGEVRDERPPMEETSFSDYSPKQGEQVPPPKDDDLPF